MPDLENSVFSLQFDPEHGTFSILTKDQKWPDILNARLDVYYRQNGQSRHGLVSMWEGCQTPVVVMQNGEHGAVQTMAFDLPCPTHGASYELTFGIVQEYPLVVWKIKVLNHSDAPINIEKIVMMQVDPSQEGSKVVFPQAKLQSEMGFYHNGWQSWSPVGWVAGDGKMPQTRLGGLQAPMIFNTGTPRPTKRGVFSSDFFAVIGDRRARKGFVLGFLSQKQHFGSIQANYNEPFRLSLWANGDNARLDSGCSCETDWAVFSPVILDHREPLEKYFEAVSRENHIRVPQESPVGWCSWYHFYTNLSAADVQANLKTIVDQQENLPIQLVQIDDGFESQIGDWFSFKSTFPEGVKPLAEEITREGLLPGLWLAPFIVHPKSALFKNHPDWILRKENGKPVNAGFVWNVLDTGLDLTVPEALEYACSVVRTAAHDWGYPYLKLDFLYAAALPGVYHDPTQTRAQVLRKGMEAVRVAVGPDVTLLGCGAPFGPMLGLVEAMRIGPDVSGDWTPHFSGIGSFFKNEPSMPCARNSIRNILNRANLHKHWWINDPDCLLIRPNTHLSIDEVQTLATSIGMTGGSLLLSDDLPRLPADRLRIAEVLLPIIGERACVIDWFDAEMPVLLRLDLLNETGGWHLVARFNWADQPVELTLNPNEYALDEGEYWFSDFWKDSTTQLKRDEGYAAGLIQPHGCVLGAFRKVNPAEAQFLGSDMHFSLGQEVAEWKTGRDELTFTVRLPRKTSGKVRVSIPWQNVYAFVGDEPASIKDLGNGVFEITVQVDGFAHVKIVKA